MTAPSTHPGELTLRRLLAGEAPAEAQAHAAACAACRARLAAFAEEQQRFEAQIPFERFAAGVERAARTPRQARPARSWAVRVGLALAATLAVGVTAKLALGERPHTHLKGGAGVEVVVAGATQRPGSTDPLAPEVLARGERVRLGVVADAWRYVAVVSVDERGEVTALYPEAGPSLALRGGREPEYLPDSVEFTGPGLERVVVVLTEAPVDVEAVVKALRTRYEEARGDLMHLPPLALPGEEFQRTFLKP